MADEMKYNNAVPSHTMQPDYVSSVSLVSKLSNLNVANCSTDMSVNDVIRNVRMEDVVAALNRDTNNFLSDVPSLLPRDCGPLFLCSILLI